MNCGALPFLGIFITRTRTYYMLKKITLFVMVKIKYLTETSKK